MPQGDYPEIGKQYVHYKGGVYKVRHLALDTTEEHPYAKPVVVYQSVEFGTYYVRPVEEFMGKVEVAENHTKDRFKLKIR